MSCKENINPSKSKHYTTMERKVFLQILERYKHIIEIKKSDGATLKDKEIAWAQICNNYNDSSLVAQQRTVQQLKKLWTNLKQSQRDALTKERQARLATGGGPQAHETTVDPDIANITPDLMKTAPCLFSSNMSESCLNKKHDLAYELICNEQDADVLQIDDNNDNIENNNNYMEKHSCNEEIILSCDIATSSSIDSSNNGKSNVQETGTIIDLGSNCTDTSSSIRKIETKKNRKRPREIYEMPDIEEKLRIERIKQIMEQEQQLADIKLQHEERISNMKENHMNEINQLELNHLKEINNIQVQINKTKLTILEYELKMKEDKS